MSSPVGSVMHGHFEKEFLGKLLLTIIEHFVSISIS